MDTEQTQPETQLEERALPKSAAGWLRELLARQQREGDEALAAVVAEMGLSLTDGWELDLAGGRFVRVRPPSPAE